METKECKGCKQAKPLSEFYTAKSKPCARCKVCMREYSKQRHHTPRGRELARKASKAYYARHGKTCPKKPAYKSVYKTSYDSMRAYGLKYQYGMQYADYLAKVEAQGGKCKICSKIGQLCVDHDHSTGLIRDLLCNNCNRGLGMFKESIEFLELAIQYLKHHQPERGPK